MLLKEFSHILNNTRLLVDKILSSEENITDGIIRLSEISSSSTDIFESTVNNLIQNNQISDVYVNSNDEGLNITLGAPATEKRSHYLTAFDQTQIQTQIMSKYIQVLCNKYGIDETEVDLDVVPVDKNNKLWLSYIFKIPRLSSKDSVSINEFGRYINNEGEYRLTGIVESGIASKIKIYVSNSNQITSASEFYAAMRSGNYTVKEKTYNSGDEFDILVKYGRSVLFRADYCNDVVLISLQNSISIKKVTLAYTDALESAENRVVINSANVLDTTPNYQYKNLLYTQKYPKNFTISIKSLDKNTYQLYSSGKLKFVFLEATSAEEAGKQDSQKKTWSIVDRNNLEVDSSSITVNGGVFEITRTFRSRMDDLGLPASLEDMFLPTDNLFNGCVTSYHLKGAFYDKENNKLIDSSTNIVTIDYSWIYESRKLSHTSSNGSVLIVIDNVIEDNETRPMAIPEMMELGYVYLTGGMATSSSVPNIYFPVLESHDRYLSHTNWRSYNGYRTSTFNTRTAYMMDGNFYKEGTITSASSFVIEYISYYVESTTPIYYFKQTVETDSEYFDREEVVDLKDYRVYDVKHVRMYFKNVPAGTTINLKSFINKYRYKVDANGNYLVKDSTGSFIDDGILDNVATASNAGSIIFDKDDNMVLQIAEDLNDEKYTLKFEDKNNNFIEPSLMNGEFTENYDDVNITKCRFIKKRNSDNEIIIQNIIPAAAGIDHFGIYSSEGKVGSLRLTNSGLLVDTKPDDAIVTFGFLSDVHMIQTDNAGYESAADFDNALTYFRNRSIKDVFISGDLSVSDSHGTYTDLETFERESSGSIYNINVYVARGNHDIGCIFGKENPNNPDKDMEYNTPDDQKMLRKADSSWAEYTQYCSAWQHTYYWPAEELSEEDLDFSRDNDYILPQEEFDVCRRTNGYNVYHYDDLTLVVIGLPLYSNGFWKGWGSSAPAYSDDQLINLEKLIRKFYKKPNTEIIIVTHLPFNYEQNSKGHAGNFNNAYNSYEMSGWYENTQYECLKALHDTYNGIIWVEGHTHIKYEYQGFLNSAEQYEDDANISFAGDAFDIHISSCGYPRTVSGSNLHNENGGSQGSLFEVYKEFIDIKDITFKESSDNGYTNKFVPVAMYRLYFVKDKKDAPESPILYINDDYQSDFTKLSHR